jgi:hypothetical protein
MRLRRLSLRWLPLWLERLLGLWRLRRLLLVLGFLSHLLDQILKRRAQRRESRGRVLLDRPSCLICDGVAVKSF